MSWYCIGLCTVVVWYTVHDSRSSTTQNVQSTDPSSTVGRAARALCTWTYVTVAQVTRSIQRTTTSMAWEEPAGEGAQEAALPLAHLPGDVWSGMYLCTYCAEPI
jgi:hypothetical protein